MFNVTLAYISAFRLFFYHDDTYLVGDPDSSIQLLKSRIYSPSSLPSDALHYANQHRLQVIFPNSGIVVAGVPVGSPSFMLQVVQNKANEIRKQLSSLKEILSMPSVFTGCQIQTVVFICRLSVVAQYNHLLRAVSPQITLSPSEDLDEALSAFLISIMDPIRAQHPENVEEASKRTLDTIFLPIRNGGCGFQSAVRTREAAYVGSWALTAGPIVRN